MKNFLIKTGVFILVFVATVAITARFMNRGNNDMTMEMGEATLPVVTMLQGEYKVNELPGYTVRMDVSSMSSNIVELGDNRELSFVIDKYEQQLTGITLEVRSCDGERLIEKIQITDYLEKGHTITVDTALKDLLEEDTEYAIVIVLTDEDEREIRYYTRCVWGTERYGEEKIAFVKYFYETTFDKEKAKELAKYMESNSSGDNTTLHKVNIHSSLSQVTWGELEVSEVMEPVIDILELGKDTGSFALRSVISSGEDKEKDYYLVEEYYRIRYTADRVYLLDFEREMTEIPQIRGEIYGNNKILLGIAGEDILLKESEDGNYVAFVTAGRLCTYNVADNKVSVLFSFYDDENGDSRTVNSEHDIKILDIDEGGNVKFAVYGYFSRGRHEGEVGVLIYTFNNTLNTIEEELYIPYEKSYEVLKCDVEKLLYLNRNNKLYVYMNQGIHEIDLTQKVNTQLAKLDQDGSMHTSEDHQIVLWNQADFLQIMDLFTEKKTKIPVSEGEILQALGFMGEDIIYGAIRETDIVENSSGVKVVPMYRVVICDSLGKVLKEYQEENVYTVSAEVVDNQITLRRVEKTENGGFEDTIPEHILNNQEQKTGKNKIVMAAVDVYETITQIQVKSAINTKTLQILTPKEVVFEGNREILIENPEDAADCYYVYNRYGVQDIYFDAGTAIARAYETSGRVVDDSGATVWFKGNRVTRNQIMAITEPKKTTVADSLAVCLDTILKFEGITVQSSELLAAGQSAQEILQSHLVDARVVDLTGCTLDAILYFVNRDIPVLATLKSGEAVLITGFNEYNVVVFEPASGKLGKKGMNDSAQWLTENGNHFITYFE